VDIDDVRAVYDQVAERYADVFADELTRKPFDRRLLDGFADQSRGTWTVVDLGCGPGHVGAYLAQRGVDVAGIDLAPEMVAVATRRHPKLRFEVGDATGLPVPNATLAGVVAFYSLIHLPRASIRAALCEVRRVLQPDGRLLLALHAGSGKVRTDEFLGEATSVEAILYRGDEIAARLDDAGFVVDLVRQRRPYPFEHPTDRLYVSARATRTPTRQIGGVGGPG
jgi:SAM-dependent methyltransferase